MQEFCRLCMIHLPEQYSQFSDQKATCHALGQYIPLRAREARRVSRNRMIDLWYIMLDCMKETRAPPLLISNIFRHREISDSGTTLCPLQRHHRTGINQPRDSHYLDDSFGNRVKG